MTTRTVTVDETLSFARRESDGVKVTLRLPDAGIHAGTAQVLLRAGRRSFLAPAEVTGDEQSATTTFTAPGARLRRAVWALELQPATGDPVNVQARLLARSDQPVALLPGPVPTTALASPEPARPVAVQIARRLPDPVQAVLRRARTVVGAFRR